MKEKIAIIGALILIIGTCFGCCVQSTGIWTSEKSLNQKENCVQVLVIIYDYKGIFEEANLYIGELKKSGIPIYKGTVHDLKLIGHPPQITTQMIPKQFCENPVKLDWGFYQIWYGSQLVVGEGYGNTIYVRNINFLPLERRMNK